MRLQALFLGIVTVSSMVSAAAVKTNKHKADTKYFRKLFLGVFEMDWRKLLVDFKADGCCLT